MKYNYRLAILFYSVLYGGDWESIASAIKNKEPYQILNCPFRFVTIGEKEYPACFYDLDCPPWIVFYIGNLSLIHERAVSVVGARECSEEGKINTCAVVNVLKRKYVIVSGLAKGIDSFAHEAALDQKTIGVLGCGIDVVYPKANAALFERMKKDHLILSEYPPGVKPYAKHFPWRNRLIASIGTCLIVIEAGMKSGTMLTVNECLDLGKDVYCLPKKFGEKKFPGCNYLIANGAQIVASIKDVEEI